MILKTKQAVIEVTGALKDKETAADLTVEFVGYKDLANNVGSKVSKSSKSFKRRCSS